VPQDYEVVPNPDGGWDVVADGASRVSSHHNTQESAHCRSGRTQIHRRCRLGDAVPMPNAGRLTGAHGYLRRGSLGSSPRTGYAIAL